MLNLEGNEFEVYSKPVQPTAAVTRRRFVGWDDNTLTDPNKPAQGVALADIAANTIGTIVCAGSPLVETGGSFSKGDPVTTDTTGRAVVGTEQNMKGRAEGASTGAGQFVPVQLVSPQRLGGSQVFKVALAAVAGAGGLLAFVNPLGVRAIVERIVLDVTTDSTGAATADFGVAANAATSSDTLIDGVDIGAAPILADNIENKGTNGKARQVLAAGQYVTGTASADPAGLVGFAYIHLIRA